jgi:glutathione-regulated potassium-efflux system ancillary protein KefC/glutathione-regulated potassium-efflux system protein KefB
MIAALVCGLLLIKALVLYALARLFRIGTPHARNLAIVLPQGGEFAFVLFSVALEHQVLGRDLVDLLIVAVTLSMAATPLLYLFNERVLRRWLEGEAPPVFDVINEDAPPPVIIAGFGRVGQVVGRILRMSQIPFTALEISQTQVDFVRKFGGKLYYGDASRVDLLRAAGAETARVLVIAIDDQAKALEIAEEAQRHFPRLTVLARAFDRRSLYDLRNKGVEMVERELFEGSLRLGVKTLIALGLDAANAERAGRIFRRHDESQVEEMAAFYGDDSAYISAARERAGMLDQVMQRDMGFIAAEQLEAAWALEQWSG